MYTYLIVLLVTMSVDCSLSHDAILSDLATHEDKTAHLQHKMNLRALHHRNQEAMQIHEVRTQNSSLECAGQGLTSIMHSGAREEIGSHNDEHSKANTYRAIF